jgi:hypothetical protein
VAIFSIPKEALKPSTTYTIKCVVQDNPVTRSSEKTIMITTLAGEGPNVDCSFSGTVINPQKPLVVSSLASVGTNVTWQIVNGSGIKFATPS